MDNMRYSGLNKNDMINGEGVCVSLFMQGCPHHCPGCFNPETWDFNGGLEAPSDLKGQIIKAISENGIQRNFSVLGGEPLCLENIHFTDEIISAVRSAYPNIKIYVWTGYTMEELYARNDSHTVNILNNINVLIDGKYIEEERDISLPLRGSRNQKIYYIAPM